MSYKPNIVFDLDGTLVDSAPSLCKAGNFLLAKLGRPQIEVETYKSFIGKGLLKQVEQLLRYTVDEFALPDNHKFHFFRHWCITNWKRHAIHTGYDISRFVGHKNPAVTERLYTHLFCTQLEEEHRVDRQDYIDNLLF